MHLVQTPGETVYEIKLTDLLCSVALEPKTFLKHFFLYRNFCRGRNKQNKTRKKTKPHITTNSKTTPHPPPPPKKNKPTKKQTPNLVIPLNVRIIQMKKGEIKILRILAGWWLYPSFNDRNLIYVETPAIWTRITFPKRLLDWKCSYLFSRLPTPIPSNIEVFRATSWFVLFSDRFQWKTLGSPVCMQLCNL